MGSSVSLPDSVLNESLPFRMHPTMSQTCKQKYLTRVNKKTFAAASSPATRAVPLRRSSSSSFSALQMGSGGLLKARILSYSVDVDT